MFSPGHFRIGTAIGQYPQCHWTQVQFCGELLFFPPLNFFPFPLSFSWHGLNPWQSPLFSYYSFLFFPSFIFLFTLLFSLLFCPLISSSSFFHAFLPLFFSPILFLFLFFLLILFLPLFFFFFSFFCLPLSPGFLFSLSSLYYPTCACAARVK